MGLVDWKILFFSLVQENMNLVDEVILSQADKNNPDLRAAIKVILSSGGKRIRPTITLLIGQMLGAPRNKLVITAASIEMLHTATLVHDDLIDGSLLRRGVPTLNSQWSPGATVLTGDFIFARAAKLAADAESIALMKIFSETLSTIVNGEITQLFSNHCVVDREEYFTRIYAKTASLFETSATTAAILCSVDEATFLSMKKFGYGMGMAFQIIDDILDFTGEQSTVGKPVGSDLRQGIVTLPTINYFDMHPENSSVKEILAGNCLDEDRTRILVEAIRISPAIDRSREEAIRYVQDGLSGLNFQKDSPEKNALQELAAYITDRKL